MTDSRLRSDSLPRSIVLTGASSGIGYAISERLVAAGHRVVGLSRRGTGPDHERFIGVSIDLTPDGSLVERLKKVIPPGFEPDVAVLNAGAPVFGNLEQIAPSEIARGLELNLIGPATVAHWIVPQLKRHDSSHLVVVGSESAKKGGRQGAVYCASKFGLRGLAQSLREECASSGLHVSLIHPGMVRTPFFDSLHFAPGDRPEEAIEPADVAEAVHFVISLRPGTVVDEMDLSPLKHVVRKK